MDLKTPKGTSDYSSSESILYEEIIEKTRQTFRTFGAVPIDTPTFELKSILMNKYGEDTKLIYDLKENGGEVCALRYDLTVPFSRFMALNKLKKIKKYQIGKVYRRDQPSIAKGRLREFIQADFDIAGEGLPMLIDSELLCCIDRLLKGYDVGPYNIFISDRRILCSILKMAKVPEEMYKTVSSTIDKIEKMDKEELFKEFISKGLTNGQIDIIYKYIALYGKEDILNHLENDPIYEIEECRKSIDELREMFKYSKILGFYETILIKLSLARGLDYYTGIIIEASYLDREIGSVVGGGRYDYLISSLLNKNERIPCIGFSVGISRIFSCLEAKRKTYTKVFVSSSGGLLLEERLKLLQLLWSNQIPAETYYNKRNNISENINLCRKNNIGFIIIVGENELEKNILSIIDVANDKKVEIKRDELIEYLK